MLRVLPTTSLAETAETQLLAVTALPTLELPRHRVNLEFDFKIVHEQYPQGRLLFDLHLA
jgi:hypothetical protein